MLNRLREALGRFWRSLSGRSGSIAVRPEPEREGGGRAAARARFWIEFREGQREADAHRSRPR
jgi:hypothetical protein